jgi:hypothetical protein
MVENTVLRGIFEIKGWGGEVANSYVMRSFPV